MFFVYVDILYVIYVIVLALLCLNVGRHGSSNQVISLNEYLKGKVQKPRVKLV